MTALKIAKFLGITPKISPELLPDTGAQIARNCKLYSGDLIPFPKPGLVANAGKTGTIRSLHALRNPDTNDLVWLTWYNQVDIVRPASDEIGDQRFYYTGDGKPKVSTYDLATTGSGSYPIDYYDLGLTLPDLKPTTVATPFTPITAESYSRDASNNVTLTTAQNHNLKSGALVTVSGFTFRVGSYSRSGTLITVTIANHHLVTGAEVQLEFTSGTATSNKYTITKTGDNTFTCIDSASGSTSGVARWSIRDLNNTQEITVVDPKTITYYSTGPKIAKTTVTESGTYSQSGTTITVTSTAHGLANGEEVLLDFTTGTATDGTFIITSVATDTFTVTSTTSLTTSGDVNWSKTSVGKIDLGGAIQARNHLYTWYTPWNEESIGSDPSDPLFIKEGQIVTVTNLPSTPPSGKSFVRAIRIYRTLSGTTDADYFRLTTLYYPNTVLGVKRTNGVSRVTLKYPHSMLVDDRFKLTGSTQPSFDITDGKVTAIIDTYTFEYKQPSEADYYSIESTGTLYYDHAENPDKDAARYWGLNDDYTFVDDFNYRSLSEVLKSNEYDPPPEDLQGLTVIQNNILAGFTGNDLYFCEPKLFHAWPSKYKRSFDSPIVGLATIGGNLLVLTESYPYVISGSDPAIMSQARLSSRYPCLNRQSIVETSFGIVYATHDGLAIYAPALAAQLLTKAIHSSDTWNASLDPYTLVGTTFKDLYFASHSAGSITFESNDQKVGPTFVDGDFTFTAAWYDSLTNDLYVVSGTNGDIYRWDDPSQPLQTMQWKSKAMITKDYTNIGAARVIADYTGEDQSTVWNLTETTWDADDQLWNQLDNITFRLYINKQLVFTTTQSNSNPFRLPSGYKTDTFEVEIESVVRVRAIHLGETVSALRTA